jgi:hypothetical protein
MANALQQSQTDPANPLSWYGYVNAQLQQPPQQSTDDIPTIDVTAHAPPAEPSPVVQAWHNLAAGPPAIWNKDNPVGTERVGDQSLTVPRGDFDPVVDLPHGGRMRQSQLDAMKEGSLTTFGDLSQIAGAEGGEGPRVPGGRTTMLPATRRGRPGPPTRRDVPPPVPEVSPGPAAVPAAAVAEAPAAVPAAAAPPPAGAAPAVPVSPEAEPAFGIGHNNPPVRNAIWAAPQTRGTATAVLGKMGSNADQTLEALGLPAYNDIVPSTNTGPVPQSMVQSGSPARPGQVFDLSDTWQVPAVQQSDLSRIDPNAGLRKGLPQHIIDATTDPDMRAKLRTVAEAGLRAGGAYWYNAEPLRLAFVSELGPAEGNAAFTQYMRTIGAVSAGSDVGQNIRTASYYNIRERQGRPVQSVEDLVSPYGHKMQNTQFGAYSDIAGGNPLDPEMRPKRASFDANLSGNQQPVTVDKHNMRLIGMLSQNPEFLNTTIEADVNYPSIGIKKGDKINFRDAVKSGRITMDQALQIPQAWKDVPAANHYAALEGFQQSLANEMGISPAQLQAALWVGGGRVTGLRSLPTSFMGAVESRLQRTAAERGGTPTKALLDFVRGKKPLLTPLAATAGAGAAANALSQPDDAGRQ